VVIIIIIIIIMDKMGGTCSEYGGGEVYTGF